MIKKHSHKAMMAQLHIAPKSLGMDEETRRDFIALHCNGKRSSADLTINQQYKLLQAYKDMGWKSQRRKASKTNNYNDAASRLMIVKWRKLANIGKLNDNTADAMERWIANQLNSVGQQLPIKINPDTLNSEQKNILIERLKQWKNRK